MNKLMTMSAAFALATTISVGGANAAVFIEDGDTHAISAGSEFFGDVEAGLGGAGAWNVQFNSTTDPLQATALATIGPIVSNQFQNLVMSWVSVATGNTLAAIAIVPSSVSLGTTFASPNNLEQFLRITWTGATANAAFDVEVSAVPLPAGLVLLLSGLMGLGFLGRSRAKAV